MNQTWASPIVMACCLAGALASAQSVSAQPFELICLAEQPAIVEGESTILRAWAVTPDGRPPALAVDLRWQATQGRIEGEAAKARWDLSGLRVPGDGRATVRATLNAKQQGGDEAKCVVEVFVGKREATAPAERGTIRGTDLISARRYLLPKQLPERGYGLYSYLLFSAPPRNDEETRRYLKTIEAYLLVLQDVDDYLQRHVRPQRLNATYIPLKRKPAPGKSNAEWAANVLAVYDYATAEILLHQLDDSYRKGPYLVSVLEPISDANNTPTHLSEDLTGIVPELAWECVTLFTYLAAQERSWSDESLQRLGIKLRNLVAVGGRVAPVTLQGLEKVVQFKRALGSGLGKQ